MIGDKCKSKSNCAGADQPSTTSNKYFRKYTPHAPYCTDTTCMIAHVLDIGGEIGDLEVACAPAHDAEALGFIAHHFLHSACPR